MAARKVYIRCAVVASVISSCVDADTTQCVLGRALQENSLTLENLEGLLESCNLSLAACNAIRVRLSLGDAACLDALVVLVDGVQLGLHTSPVSIGIGGVLVQSLELLGLVLDTLLLGGHGDGVLLGFLFIL